MVKFTFASLLLVTLITTSCGGGDDPSHMLVSLQVTPGSAEGNAQFTAIGTFADGYTATIAALWTLGPPFSLTPATPIPGGVSLSAAGLAKCTGYQHSDFESNNEHEECKRNCAICVSVGSICSGLIPA